MELSNHIKSRCLYYSAGDLPLSAATSAESHVKVKPESGAAVMETGTLRVLKAGDTLLFHVCTCSLATAGTLPKFKPNFCSLFSHLPLGCLEAVMALDGHGSSAA